MTKSNPPVCLHASLSWEPRQEPTQQEMTATARNFLEALGAEPVPKISAVHEDEIFVVHGGKRRKIKPAA